MSLYDLTDQLTYCHNFIFVSAPECRDIVLDSLVPRPPRPVFVACHAVRKAGRRPGRIYHVMHAAADVMFSLLTSGFVLSPSHFFPWIQFILSLQFVPQVRLLLDRSWLAQYVTSAAAHIT